MRRKTADLRRVKIDDPFWSKHVDLVKDTIIPYQWEAMNDRIEDAESSHCLENFRIAAGEAEGEFYGAVFQDTDVAKWLEAVGFTLASVKDEELEKTADEAIDLIVRAQQDDGYINTYFRIKEPERRWKNLCEGHELYTAGHLMEAAVAYYIGTGKDKFLKAVMRFADLICETFGPGEDQIHGYPGHQEVEIGLIKLYRISGKKKYLDMAKYFIDIRGVGENYFLKEMAKPDYKNIFPEFAGYQPAYSQSHMPVREQKTAEGHAVRAVYMYCAMADLAEEYQDEELLNACRTLWNNIVTKRMYITGGIGSSGILERFTTDYDLPNEYNYSESCASIGLALFGMRMANITKDASYIDTVERALYNTVLAGIAMDGKSFFYVNPLEVWPPACMERTSKEHVKPVRQKWFGVSCCPPNIARTLASLGQYIYSIDEDGIFVNLFISNETEMDINSNSVTVEIQTEFPKKNDISVKLTSVPKDGMKLGVRIPGYAEEFKIFEGKEELEFEEDRHYAVLDVKSDTEFFVSFKAPARYVWSNPNVRADAGKVAITKGPLVYCLEEVDNGSNLPLLYADTDKPLEEVESNLFGGTTLIRAIGKRRKEEGWSEDILYGQIRPEYEDTVLTAVPYFCWSNREKGEMNVWIKEFINGR